MFARTHASLSLNIALSHLFYLNSKGLENEGMERRFKYISAVGIAVVVVVMAFTGCIGIDESSVGSSATQAKVVVDYNGTWTGGIGTLDGVKRVDGTGHQEITVDRGNETIFGVAALVYKTDASNATLTVSIEDMNGTVIETDSTNTPNGVVTVVAHIS